MKDVILNTKGFYFYYLNIVFVTVNESGEGVGRRENGTGKE